MSKLILQLTEDNQLSVEVEGMTMDQFMSVMFTGLQAQIQQFCKSLKEDERITEEQEKTVKEDMYDYINHACSSVLLMCFPEIEMRPSLTEEAMKRVIQEEDKIMEEVMSQVKGAEVSE